MDLRDLAADRLLCEPFFGPMEQIANERRVALAAALDEIERLKQVCVVKCLDGDDVWYSEVGTEEEQAIMYDSPDTAWAAVRKAAFQKGPNDATK